MEVENGTCDCFSTHPSSVQPQAVFGMQMGAAAGSGIAAAMTTQGMLPPGIWSVLGGAAVGTAAGLLAHGATAPKKEKGPKKKWLAGVTKDVQDAIEAMQ